MQFPSGVWPSRGLLPHRCPTGRPTRPCVVRVGHPGVLCRSPGVHSEHLHSSIGHCRLLLGRWYVSFDDQDGLAACAPYTARSADRLRSVAPALLLHPQTRLPTKSRKSLFALGGGVCDPGGRPFQLGISGSPLKPPLAYPASGLQLCWDPLGVHLFGASWSLLGIFSDLEQQTENIRCPKLCPLI